ncbi:type I restriction enzyme specificity HsdS domain protein [Mycoplasma haemocanis str. Illinois]|uniref:Type I restriction enzyme specificity HsdS domain protein n=1 Tax=Mycoplasma haemocanis (strain Illinois) TaxID=1111676 RepID=H6N6Z2_MYCHN|nr:restriction endonuclease subunit S [Mycoplasma haemocanis]AEW45414.1 type I restriction enzyme specificity HsdS domain protein [Mycoplasma haemocanis str. Illinois]
MEEKRLQEFLLGEVCDVQNGYTFSISQHRNVGNPIIRVRNVHNYQLQLDDIVYFGDNEIDLSKFALRPEDLVITAIGDFKVAWNQTNNSFYLNQGVWRLDPNLEILDKRWLFHFLSNLDLSSIISRGGVLPYLSIEKFKKIKIPVPSMSDQKNIAYKLDKLLELKEELRLRKKQNNYYRGKAWESFLSLAK